MASVQRIDDNKYKIYVELGYNDFGKRIRRTKTVTVTSDRDLKNKIRDFEIECFTNKEENLDNITFEGFVKRWMKNHVDANLSILTKQTYQTVLDATILDYFGKMQLKKIRKFHVVEFFTQEKTKGNGRLKIKLTVLKSIFSKALEWEVINSNPAEKVKVSNENPKETGFYTEEEVVRLFEVLEQVNPKHKMIIKLAVIGGLRRGEILGLRLESIDFENESVYVDKQLIFRDDDKRYFLTDTKHKKPRTVFLPSDFMRELKTYVVKQKEKRLAMGNLWRGFYIDGKKVNLLFTKDDGTPTRPEVTTQIWNTIVKKYNLKRIRFHDLRHTSASLLVKKGVNFKVIQERLGHSDIKMTMNRYSHLTDEQEKEAARVFDDIL